MIVIQFSETFGKLNIFKSTTLRTLLCVFSAISLGAMSFGNEMVIEATRDHF